MTKYILHGGDTTEDSPDNNAFYLEMTLGLKGKIKVLICGFAWESILEDKLNLYKKMFLKNSQNKNIEFELADPDNLAEQLKDADIFFIAGGDTFRLMKRLSKTSNLEGLVRGKVVSGSSAGAYALCRYFYDNDHKQIAKGTGILNIKCYCHFDKSKLDELTQLVNYRERLPVLPLTEQKWQLFYKSA